MPAAVAQSFRNTGAAAGTATCTFSATAGNQLEAFIRGSANASATVANVYDNSVGDFTSSGTPTTTTISVATTPWTAGALVGRVITITNAGDPLFRTSRTITANTTNTLTFNAFGSAPIAAGTFSVGNLWQIADSAHGNAWTADGGVATSHAQWWEALSCAAASSATFTVVWGGGNTAFTIDVHEISGAFAPAQTTTAASGNSAAPTCGSITASVAGILLGGFSCPTTNQTWSNELDNSGGATMTQDTPASGTYRMLVDSLHESAGTYAPRATMSTSEGWVAIPLFIPESAPSTAHSAAYIRNQSRFFRRRRIV